MGLEYSDCFKFNFNFTNVKNMKEILLNFKSEIEYVWDFGFVHGLAIGFNVCTLVVCLKVYFDCVSHRISNQKLNRRNH